MKGSNEDTLGLFAPDPNQVFAFLPVSAETKLIYQIMFFPLLESRG